MHEFPLDQPVRQKLVKFMQQHQHYFREPLSKYTLLCSEHFEESCNKRRYCGMLTDENKMQVILPKGSVQPSILHQPKKQKPSLMTKTTGEDTEIIN